MKLIIITLLLLLLAVVVAILVIKTTKETFESSNLKKNLAALEKLRHLGPADINTTLFPAAEWNNQLVFKDIQGVKHVLVVTLTSTARESPVTPSSHTSSLNAVRQMGLFGRLWVTLWPEALLWAKKQDINTISPARLGQLLGLNVADPPTHAQFMWVPLTSLLRPCIDPETDDFECRLAPFSKIPQPVFGSYGNPEWEKEILQNRLDAINPSNISDKTGGYPFTGLGYTYDWGSMQAGLSEYIVLPGTAFVTESFIDIATYVQILQGKKNLVLR